ncbi:Polynucleotide 5'-hydroxyl-kinase grc3 [Coemansia sp. RSA 1804]|nr:Polynucleotide 5'-hydroxyl-kinase grc3 [Coemansia sp. RSA 1804]
MKKRYGSMAEIPLGQSIAFQGIVDVCVVHGAVSVYGYTAVPEDGWLRVYSPSSHPLVQITSIPHKERRRREGKWSLPLETVGDTAAMEDELLQLRKLWSEHRGIDHNENKCSISVSLVAFRAVDCGLAKIGQVAPPYRELFTAKPFEERVDPSPTNKKNLKRKLAFSRNSSTPKLIRTSKAEETTAMVEDDQSDAEASEEYAGLIGLHAEAEELLTSTIGLPGFHPVLFLTSEQQLLMTPRDWIETLDMAGSAPLQLDDAFNPVCPTYVIAGGSSQGKSTFSRFLLNRLLNRFGRLFYMETDLGQSEMAPPGSLSVTLLSNPLLGPPFTHTSQIEPLHAIYTGTTSPKGDPDRYIAAIRCLSGVVQEYTCALRSESVHHDASGGSAVDLDSQVIPVVVNTHGWLKGLGLDLHYSLCEVVQPTTYIQLYDPLARTADNETAKDEEWQDSGDPIADQLAPIIDFSSISTCNPQLVWVSAMTPERAVQMLRSRSSSSMFNNLVAEEARDDSQQEEGESVSSVAVDSQPVSDLVVAQPEATGKRSARRTTAQDMRVLALVSHFYCSGGSVCLQGNNDTSLRYLRNLAWNMRKPLAACRPLLVPLPALVFWLGDEEVPPSQLLRALNGSIVGVIATSVAHTRNGSPAWTNEAIGGLYADDESLSDNAVSRLSEPGSRMLLRSAVESFQSKQSIGNVSLDSLPQIVYGHPSMDTTTFVCHALVRSVDSVNGNVQLILPPLATSSVEQSSAAHADSQSSSAQKATNSILRRIVGLYKGPGPSELGIELPIWPMIDGGYSKRAMGSSSVCTKDKYGNSRYGSNLCIKEAPYLSVETDEGIGASTGRSRGGQMRRTLLQ